MLICKLPLPYGISEPAAVVLSRVPVPPEAQVTASVLTSAAASEQAMLLPVAPQTDATQVPTVHIGVQSPTSFEAFGWHIWELGRFCK